MRVARLEVFGFKSFMDRLLLPLEGGITGVVGPNGCGKSNIVDALRWVLGETRAHSLRGGVLEDVIFNGTDKLRPLGLAEVTITLRAQEANFFEDLVSPQLEAEKIFKNLEKEITEEKGEGRLRVISGGKKSEDEAAEDEAVESTHVDVQESTEDEGEVATTVLTRFSWLKSVSEVQITRRLYRSGESEFFINRVPCRLKDLKDFFRAIGLSTRAYTIVAQGEVSRIVTAKPEERRLILEEAAGVVGFRDKIAASNRKLDETSQNVLRLKDVLSEIDRQVSSLKRQAQRAQQRQQLKDQLLEFETSIFKDKFYTLSDRFEQARTKVSASKHAVTAAEAALNEAQLREESARIELTGVDTEGETLRGQIDQLREELLNRARQRSMRSGRVNELRAFNAARETEIHRLEERLQTLHIRKTDLEKEIETLVGKEKALEEKIHALEHHDQSSLQEAAHQLKEARDSVRKKEQEIHTVRERVVAIQSNLEAISEQIIASSPRDQIEKTLGSHTPEKLRTVLSKAEIFVQGLSIPSTYAKAVQAIINERAAFLVTDDPHHLAQAFLQDASQKDVKGLGIGVLKAGDVPVVMRQKTPFKSLLSCIEVAPRFSLAATRMFENVFVVESVEEGVQYFQREDAAKEVILVTLQGDVITEYSFFSLRHDGGLVQLQNRSIELQRNAKVEQECLDEELKQLEALEKGVVTLEERQSVLLLESEQRQQETKSLSNEQANIRGRLHAEWRIVHEVIQDIERVTGQVHEIQLKISESSEEETTLVSQIEDEKEDSDRLLEEQVKALTEQYLSVDSVRKEGRTRLSTLALAVQDARSGLDEIRKQENAVALELQKVELEEQSLHERIITEYGTDYLESVQKDVTEAHQLTNEQRTEAEHEIVRIKNRIAREGEVDSTSIQQYQDELERQQNLSKQLKDLQEAAEVLKTTIARLEELSKTRFLSMFRAVSRNFGRLIPQLFGGGKGALQLTDPERPLECGIDIIMRPPGKKPKSIDLLSGGEKALCATGLIFAMFLERPSPLCVLDEVDAPLDEANLMRFLALVKEMSSRTQFMLVTHNKRSMAMADNLIGVTMQEPGSSKVISVSLQEAFSQVA